MAASDYTELVALVGVAAALMLRQRGEQEEEEGPTAKFTTSEVSDLTVRFDAGPSSDPDGTIAIYEWTIAGNSFTGEVVEVTFDSPGDVQVTLTVTDDSERTDSVTKTVTVPEPTTRPDGFGERSFGSGPYGDPATDSTAV